MKFALAFSLTFLVPTIAVAQNANHDITKLPEGSIWEGAFNMYTGQKVIFSSGFEIKITRRDKTTFEGEWTFSAMDFFGKWCKGSNRGDDFPEQSILQVHERT